ncbi:putative disease resistance protein At1g50180 [Salvia hispanica]|uniref:putative disease resistance protein At1g50180 n=1 Tax=Salvia hispanica TaxID=49212 RepID=UPI00200923A4|nr:putative disease resistance protein At1g50180 [Salvia hispanica]
MVVIDDIRKTEHWDGLNHALNFEGTKTKILLTTRKQNIANIGFAIKIGLPNDNEGREFLERKALPYISSQDFRFEENGRKTMAEGVASMALKTIHDLLLEETKFLIGVRSEVKTLDVILKEMNALLIAADNRERREDMVNHWLRNVRELAYRADDTISLYAAIYVSSSRSLRHKFSCILTEGYSLHKIGSEIKEVKSEMARLNARMDQYGMHRIVQGESSAHPSVSILSFETEVFVGKKEEVEQLVSHLVGDEANPVISLWGMGGIGKTTIAKRVYNHPTTRRFFDSFAWICVSQKWDLESLLLNVLRKLSPLHNTSGLTVTELTEELFQVQEAKKCMIVIDDIWSTQAWDQLQLAFNPKTKILLTTRIHDVAKIGFAIKACLLTDDEGWELLNIKRNAPILTDVPAEEIIMLEKIGREMVAKCGNLPLAISLLGGILSNKKSSAEWRLVNENLSDENLNDKIRKVLHLSYQDLPYYLKPCFLYMGMYKEDEDIPAIDICVLWIAQGMISQPLDNRGNEMSLMDIAQSYLTELASRSVVEITRDDPIRGQTTRMCKLHDAVQEMCLSLAIDEDFGLRNLDYEGGPFSGFFHDSLSRRKTRHLIVYLKSRLEEESGEPAVTCDQDITKIVRSLLFINDMEGIPLTQFPHRIVRLKEFKVLKTLSICGFVFEGRKLLKEISKLVLLRILRLRDCLFDELPSSLKNLVYLHTLDLWNSGNILIPNGVLNRMLRLRHLILPVYYAENLEDYRMSLEGLEQLETLVGYNSLVHQLESPTQMTNLRHFEGIVHDNQSLSDIIDAFCTSRNHCKCGGLRIKQGCHISSEEDLMIFKKVFKLHNLYIDVPIENLFKELGSEAYTSNLLYLILSESNIQEDPMETLGKLPHLVDLWMTEACFLGEEITCHASSFPSLKKLGIEELPNLRGWKVEEGAMPLVSKIRIHGCPLLEMVPDGLRFLNALTDLEISGMPQLGARVSEGGEDFHKVQHVPSIVIRN